MKLPLWRRLDHNLNPVHIFAPFTALSSWASWSRKRSTPSKDPRLLLNAGFGITSESATIRPQHCSRD